MNIYKKEERQMTINLKKQGQDSVVVFLSGRFDNSASPIFEQKVKPFLNGTCDIVLDFKDINYISSSELYLLLQAYMVMNLNKRKLIIRNLGEPVRGVFDATGFISLFVEDKE
jgi:anti-sigma B factor antagonist